MTIIRKFELEENKKIPLFNNKRIIALGVIFLGLLLVIQIWVSHQVASFGRDFKKIEEVEKSLRFENKLLELEINKRKALQAISSSSAELGFIVPKAVQYIR